MMILILIMNDGKKGRKVDKIDFSPDRGSDFRKLTF